VSSGERVLALCADASRRSELAAGATGLARVAGGAARVACGRCATEAIRAVGDGGGERLALTDYAALALEPGLPLEFDHVVLVDPPPFPHLAALAERGPADRPAFLHRAWGEEERGFALRVLERELGLRIPLGALFRALRNPDPAEGQTLRSLLAGAGRHARSPELTGRCVRVLVELGLVALEPNVPEPRLRVVSSDGTDLERSSSFRAYGARHEEGKRYLANLIQR
jgi:hypothetical protein